MSEKVFIAKIEGEDAKKVLAVLEKQYAIRAHKNTDGSLELYAED